LIDAFFFDGGEHRLFGAIHHPSEGTESRDIGVLICYPLWEEHVRSHRTFVSLGFMLGGIGLPTMRFDYFGTGDSMGSDVDATPRIWLDNVEQAANCLRKRTGIRRLCLVGQRLGATLAAIAQSRISWLDSLVLWEPVSDGPTYLDELRNVHERWLTSSFARGSRSDVLEFQGFLVSERAEDEIRQLSFPDGATSPGRRILLINSVPPDSKFLNRLQRGSAKVQSVVIPACEAWRKDRGPDKGLGVIRACRQIVHWVEGL